MPSWAFVNTCFHFYGSRNKIFTLIQEAGLLCSHCLINNLRSIYGNGISFKSPEIPFKIFSPKKFGVGKVGFFHP